MRSKFKWIFTLLLAFSMQFSFAQEKTVTGVVAENGMPLPGVTVAVKGTTNGTQTDFDGKFSIRVTTGQVLEFSYIGFKTQSLTVGNTNTLNITMVNDDAVSLGEVVVVGYSSTTKEAFTGTAAKIDVENIQAKAVSNVSQALRGEVAGVNVITGSGAPGSDATIRIRGFGSVNGNQSPLYVVDGAPFSSDVSAINPADIESMVVLKDAAATSIYGSRGANGVILITTKQGKSGTSVVSVDFRTSVNSLRLPQYDYMTSPEEYIETSWSALRTKGFLQGNANPEAFANANLYGSSTEAINPLYNIWNVAGDQLIDPTTGKFNSGVQRKFTPTKWSDAAFGTGIRSEANVQFSGGTDKTKYAMSFGYLNDEGYTVKSNYKRYTTRINLEHKPKDWLTVSGNIGFTGARYTNSSSDENESASSGNIFALTSTTPAIYDVYLRDENGDLVADPIFGGSQYDYGNGTGRRAWTLTNGIADANYDLSQSDATTILGNFNLAAKIVKNLTFEARYSGQYQNSENANRNNQYYGGWAAAGGLLSISTDKSTNQNFLQLLRFNKSFDKHGLEAFVAHESTDYNRKVFAASAQKAILPSTLDLTQYTTPFGRANSYTQGYTLESYFGQVNYNYDQKYYVTASARRDGSSRFINNKWGTFGSVGLGWIISREDFLVNSNTVNYLKLKASYGLIGDQGSSLRYGWTTYDIGQTADGSYSFLRTSERANPDLTWETSKIAQVGFESSFFNNTLDVDVDYYVKNTNDLFFTQSLSLFPGYSTRQINDGELRNSGIEFSVNAHIIKAETAGDFKLSIGVNGEVMKNEITQMPIDLGTGKAKVLDGALSEGHSLYDWYMREWAGVDVATGSGLWNMYFDDMDGNGIFDGADAPIQSMHTYLAANPDANVKKTTTSIYSQATEKYVGKSAIPKVRGSFRLNAEYKNFDINAQFGYSFGGYVYDSGYATLMQSGGQIGKDNYHTDMRDAWKEPGDVTNVPRLSAAFGTDSNFSSRSTRFLAKADYLSLNNVKIGYTVPKRFTDNMAISNLNIYATGDNLMMLSARDGLNPSTLISSSNSGIYMPMTTISLGAKIIF